MSDSKNSNPKRKAAFTATRLTPTVFKIIEYDDIFSEHPFIYAKVLSDVIVLIDSGCGGKTEYEKVDVRSLREFVETWPIEDNNHRPLNEGSARRYVVVCTHCHYDHILGLEHFASDSQIVASSHCPSFLSPENIDRNSLCERLGIRAPKYKPSLVDHLSMVTYDESSTGIQVLHTPGHTPDELALWDENEAMLYVGDTVYEWAPIIFPPEGNIVDWITSMDFLIDFVQGRSEVKINAGHCTSMVDASDVLNQGKSFIMDVLTGKEHLKGRTKIGGIPVVYYVRKDGRFSLRCPEALVDDARKRLPQL